MAFERPTLKELVERAQADMATRLPGAEPLARRSNLAVISRVNAGAVHGLYGYLERLAVQLMPDTAELAYLERWGSIWGVRRKAATAAAGTVTVTGRVGSVIPAGALLRQADGTRYATTAEATLTATSAAVEVVATVTGAAANADAGLGLTMVSPLDGVTSTAVVASGGLTGGADEETDASLRARVLARIQEPPKGGAAADYVTWALECAGVTRAYCFPGRLGPGTVGVTFLMDDADGGPIPTTEDVATVQAYIDAVDDTGYPFRRPVTAAVTVFALEAAPLDFAIQLTPNTATVQAAVAAELADLIRREAEPEGALLISHIRAAISLAAGEIDHVLTSPTADVDAGAGEIITLGAITWS